MLAHSQYIPAQTYIAMTTTAQKKIFASKRILKENYLTLLRMGTDLIDLMDKDKISFRISLTELNSVLELGGFSKGEQAYIRRMRHQGRNNVAAKKLRIKKRKEELTEEENIKILQRERQELLNEKEKLRSEIEFYSGAISQ